MRRGGPVNQTLFSRWWAIFGLEATGTTITRSTDYDVSDVVPLTLGALRFCDQIYVFGWLGP